MNKAVKLDLADTSDALEHLVKTLPNLTLNEQVDVAARIRAVVKHAETIDKAVKEAIKKKLREKDGVVLGEIFKAKLAYNPVTRLNQGRLKEEKPDVFEAFSDTKPEGKVTFEPR